MRLDHRGSVNDPTVHGTRTTLVCLGTPLPRRQRWDDVGADGMERKQHRMKIAVIGTGIAGMSAAWLLNTRHDVTVYEKNPRAGGHSNTVEVATRAGPTAVDTGFIVYNTLNYPNLTALFTHLGVPTKASDMSFAASLRGGRLEYAGTDLNGLLGQRRNILRPRFWRMIKDLLRFYRSAPALLADPQSRALSLGDYLGREGYSAEFIDDHLLPMGAAIWSTTPPDMLAYPAAAFISFFQSHGLLLLRDRPQWRTVDGGSREYVRRLTASYSDSIRFRGVRAIKRKPSGVEVEDFQGHVDYFDHVVIASHADEALALLADPDEREHTLLRPWRYTKNAAVLHSDPSLMPRRKRVWASWNFVEPTEKSDASQLCVTYWMNRLQGLRQDEPFFVTLNPALQPAAALKHYEITYTHPLFDEAARRSQRGLWSLQGRRNTWFCGSYFGFGFHEDALQAGLAVAERLGDVRRPWQVDGESARIQLPPAKALDNAA